MPISIVRRDPADWPALAGMLHAWNRRADGGVHCLHAASGDDVDAHAAELAALVPDEAAFWVIMDSERPVGVFGCEFDPALGRAWLRGPLGVDPGVLTAALAVVDATLEAALPAIRQFDAFPATESALLNGWYAAAGYTPLQVHSALRAEVGAAPPAPTGVERATIQDLAAVLAWHNELFPAPYLGEPAFRRALDAPDCALFVARDGDGAPLGYLYVEDHPAEMEAYIHYLGVVASQRGRGHGRALLGAAACWTAERGRPHLALTVREDRPAALELYRRTGFVEVSTGRHWRRATGAS